MEFNEFHNLLFSSHQTIYSCTKIFCNHILFDSFLVIMKFTQLEKKVKINEIELYIIKILLLSRGHGIFKFI